VRPSSTKTHGGSLAAQAIPVISRDFSPDENGEVFSLCPGVQENSFIMSESCMKTHRDWMEDINL